MIDDINLVAKPRDHAAEFLRAANIRRQRTEARDLQYSFGLFLSGCLQVVLALALLGMAESRHDYLFSPLHHNVNIALAGVAFLPALAAFRRGDRAQKFTAVPFAILPIGVLFHYAYWALWISERLRTTPGNIQIWWRC